MLDISNDDGHGCWCDAMHLIVLGFYLTSSLKRRRASWEWSWVELVSLWVFAKPFAACFEEDFLGLLRRFVWFLGDVIFCYRIHDLYAHELHSKNLSCTDVKFLCGGLASTSFFCPCMEIEISIFFPKQESRLLNSLIVLFSTMKYLDNYYMVFHPL
jgi:hypothetical protein